MIRIVFRSLPPAPVFPDVVVVASDVPRAGEEIELDGMPRLTVDKVLWEVRRKAKADALEAVVFLTVPR